MITVHFAWGFYDTIILASKTSQNLYIWDHRQFIVISSCNQLTVTTPGNISWWQARQVSRDNRLREIVRDREREGWREGEKERQMSPRTQQRWNPTPTEMMTVWGGPPGTSWAWNCASCLLPPATCHPSPQSAFSTPPPITMDTNVKGYTIKTHYPSWKLSPLSNYYDKCLQVFIYAII